MGLSDQRQEQLLAEYKGMIFEQQMQNYVYQCERMQPHIIHSAKVFKDGDEWCCLLGGDIQSGICGFGKKPKEACLQFDIAWG